MSIEGNAGRPRNVVEEEAVTDAEKAGLPETQPEGRENILLPEQALEEERRALRKFEQAGGGKMKRVIASLLLGSALVLGAGGFHEASAGERRTSQSWVEDTSKKWDAKAQDVQEKYYGETRRIWEKFASEVERIKRDYPQERFSSEVTQRVLDIIKNMREYPSSNPAQRQIMEEQFVKTWLYTHAEVTKGVDTRKDNLTLRDAQGSADALNRSLMRSFDASGDEVLDRNEIEAYENAVNGSRGLSILRGIKLHQEIGVPPSR